MSSEEEITFDDKAELLSEESRKKTSSFFSLQYYQQYFDVDTRKVGQRLLWSMMPSPGSSFLENHIRPKPDLYGPFWTCITLIFLIAITSNLANYLQTAASGHFVWKMDFHKVSYAATAVMSYAYLVPLMLWAFLRHLSLLEVLSLYGYSLAIYIPISVLWVVNITWMRWTLVIVGSLLSGFVLISSIWPLLKEHKKKVAALTLLLLHILLAIGFMAFFYNIMESPEAEIKKQSISREGVMPKPQTGKPLHSVKSDASFV